MSTLTIPPVLVSPRDDAIQLYRAFKGLGCDTAAVVNILAHRDATQRALIQQEYRTMYSHDLIKHLSSELSGNVKKAILLWMQDPAGRDATIVRQALSGDLIDLEAATEVICSRTPSQIQQFKQIYHVKFGAYLEHDIEFCASGDHKKLLLAYVSTPRYEGLEHDRMMAENDAKALFKAGEKRLGTDERPLSTSSVEEAGHTWLLLVLLTITVKKETSGHFEYALLTILRCSENPAKYFARVLYKAMKGLGTNDTTLIRVIVSRTEIDMQYIKAEYQKKYKKTLNGAVHSETSGHYRTFLLGLLGPNQ